MRRFYVVPHHVWAGDVEVEGRRVRHIDLFHPAIGSHGIHLIEYTSPEHAELLHSDEDVVLSRDGVGPAAWEALDEVKAWRDAGSNMLLSTDFRTEESELLWHAHPEVARLQHPSLEGTVTLAELHQKAEHGHKQFKKHHMDALGVIGVKPNHTVLDVHRLAKARNPLCRLGAFY
jgi:hypothetical protein